MCGRYTLSTGHEALARAFLAEFSEELKASWKPRYNISPGTGIVAILEDRDRGGSREANVLHWGLVPKWAKDVNIGYKMINARAETIEQKPAFKDAFRYRRCLIPASGFYEWDRRTSPRQPYYFHRSDELIMAIAGIWEYWLHPGGSEIYSASLVTMPATGRIEQIHHRMPVVLPEDQWAQWLDTDFVKPDMRPFLQAAQNALDLEMHPVATAVNKGDRDNPELIEPIEGVEPGRPSGDEQLDLFGS